MMMNLKMMMMVWELAWEELPMVELQGLLLELGS
jgi:hypothetical protein